MIEKGTALYSITHLVCPRCQEEKLFAHSVYNLRKLGEMRRECNHCGLKYSIEPGFFYGAAYVSYGLTVGIGIFTFLLLYWLWRDASVEAYVLVICSALIVAFPLCFALSRVIWLNMFVKYDPAPHTRTNVSR
jgi:uncharacterized protein (DUF983 family)